ncbi:MAG: hypothetical protein EAX96_17395 [Candidatus Lokiarchaeota archaeon]|nr:hypothetical protein [Candidatus Lokiarchaeota archaeon]
MSIDWAKVIEKPDKEHKVVGSYLLSTRQKIEAQEKTIEDLNGSIAEITHQLKKSKEILETTIEQQKQITNDLKDQIVAKDGEINKLNGDISNLNGQFEALKNQIIDLNSTMASSNQELQSVLDGQTGEIEQLNQIISQKDQEIQNLNSNLSDLKNHITQKDNQINDLQSQLNLLGEFQQNIQSLNIQLEEKNAEISKIYEDHTSELAELKENANAEVNSIKAEINSIREKNLNELNDLNNQLMAANDEKNKILEEIKIKFEQEKSEISEKMKQEVEQQVNDIEQNYLEEINELKMKIQELTPKIVEKPSVEPANAVASFLKKAEPEISKIILRFDGKEFIQQTTFNEDSINLVLNPDAQRWQLSWAVTSTLIDRKTAERQARSIAKSGYAIGAERYGLGLELELIGSQTIPEALTRDQHSYNE